ncbi:acyltransferase family protein [Deinococcus yavapaiensis]|uniref:acyltransferase family protein n=1 Tax=Deinococcus yavapaiensis TaxID=309889 RepID=UPI001473674D|nr:acyltransferase [Deinococcus yavapaiensis]
MAIISVVVLHCLLAVPGPNALINIALVQALKFGTISFFVIGGYLFGRQNPHDSETYLRRRLTTLLSPWAFWAVVYLLFSLMRDASFEGVPVVHPPAPAYLLAKARWLLFETGYWFVPNFFVTQCLVTILWRKKQPLWLLAAAFLFSTIYALNIYTNWTSLPNHSEALLGFLPFMLLGVLAAKNAQKVEEVARKTSWWIVGVLCAGPFLAGVLEGWFLHVHEGLDLGASMNTLRLSNQLYSLAVLFGLYKLFLTRPRWKLDGRQLTYGVHLVHQPILEAVAILPFSYYFANYTLVYTFASHWMPGVVAHLLTWGVFSGTTYAASTMLATLIARSHWSGLIGIRTRQVPRQAITARLESEAGPAPAQH